MIGRYLLLLAWVLSAWPVCLHGVEATPADPPVFAGSVPSASAPSCAYCGKQGGGNPNCRYCSGRSSSSSSSSSQNYNQNPDGIAPIFSVPVGIFAGVFIGGGWFCKEMVGDYKGVNPFSSYHSFMSLDTHDPGFDGPWNFGTHIGGLPWLALYPAGWLVKGIGTVAVWGTVKTGKAVASIFEPGPPSPEELKQKREYLQIAQTYRGLSLEAEVNATRAERKVEAARATETRYLDDLIQNDGELGKYLLTYGLAAARDKARRRLDAYSKSYRERRKIAGQAAATINELRAMQREALKPICSDLLGTIMDAPAASEEGLIDLAIDGGKLSPAELAEASARKRIFTKAKKAKAWIGNALSVKEIYDDYRESRKNGTDPGDWLMKQKTVDKVGRLLLKTLGPGGEMAEKAGDYTYALSAVVVTSCRISSIDNSIRKTQTMAARGDLLAREWAELTERTKASEAHHDSAQKRKNTYDEESARYEKMAKKIR